MALFKYLPRKYLESFLKKGSLKIGTLYEYRQIEKYGTVIGDQNEGLHKTELHLPGGGEIDLGKNSIEAEFFRKHVLRPDQQDAKVKIFLADGARLIAQTNSQDLYVFCTTAEYNESVMKEFGCDSCLEIVNPNGFFAAISKRIRHEAKFDGYAAVVYVDKHTHYTRPHQLHPAIMKDPQYSYQKEWRAIWIPEKAPRQPLIIDVPKAIKYCRVVEPLSRNTSQVIDLR